MLRRIRDIDNRWFFTELPYPLKILSFFIRGDLLILFPLLIVILLLGLINIRFMTIMVGVYIMIRNLGEMIYWFSHQFYERKYRPYDFGFKKLDNHAIYILYQTIAMAGTILGAGITLYFTLFVK